jgi:hypothetical protein
VKQGPSTSKPGSQKVEPRPKSISPGAVSSIGIQEVRTKSEPMVQGRGYKAPMASCGTHKAGSQGKH